ncbi:MAG: hypothetical protein CVV14_08710 [Gammaproteobacteria bacterium HGW-Gammaproteobacteria-4]|jgi:hypothetical protein|nr:MAG: hypothetical protein CVV14_08710 [Gammaproteobacteria bacterium HGW-Gammaproteobacteria-4]
MSTRSQLARLLRTARLRRVLIVVVCALPLLAVAGAAGWRWLGRDGTCALVAGALLATALLALAHASRLNLLWLCRRLDATQRNMDDSSALLLQHPATMAPLAKLQRARIAGRLRHASAADLREAWPRNTLLSLWLLGLAGVASIALVPRASPPLPATATPVAADEPATSVPHLAGASIDIAPPTYTGLNAYTSNELDAQVAHGARLHWRLRFEPEPTQASLVFLDGLVLPLTLVEGEWQAERELTAAALYRIEAAAAAVEMGKRIYRVQTLPDRPPELRVIAPTQALSLHRDGQTTWSVLLEASDDYGLGSAQAAITHSQGSGENVQFSDSTVTLAGTGSATRRQYRHDIDLDALGYSEGDDLIVSLSVRDNRQPEANISKHPSLILRWPPAASAASDALEGIVQTTLPAYFRSQRQIIIDTEALIAERAQLAKAEFVDRSDAIGVDQRILRLRYGQFLGEEAEGIERPPEDDDGDEADADHREPEPGHEHEAEPARLGDDVAVVAQFGHSHDHAEATTLFDPATRALLKSALDAMWQSEGMLRQGQPADALPHAYRALDFIKQVQQASRIYLARVGLELPPIDFARRLSGKRDSLRSRRDPLADADAQRLPVAEAWQALDRPEHDIDSKLAALANWIVAQDDPDGVLLDALAASASVRRDPACIACRSQLKQALWPLLPTPPANAALRPQLSESARAYLDAIEQDNPARTQP